MTIETMHCGRLEMTLTTRGCARMFTGAVDRPPEPWEGRSHCVNCPIGAKNAGVTLAPTADAVHAIRHICPRCNNVSDRYVGDICITCYNREGEVIRGRNGKGNAPQTVLRGGGIYVSNGTSHRRVEYDRLFSPDEAIIRLSKHATGVLTFGRGPVSLGQMALGL